MLRTHIPCQQPTAIPIQRGFLNVELLIATLVLGIAMTLLLPGLSAAARIRQERQFEVLARLELNNLRIATEATPTAAQQLSAWFLTRYPDAKLQISAVPATELWPAGEGLRFSISRPAPDSTRTVPVTLVCWPAAGRLPGTAP